MNYPIGKEPPICTNMQQHITIQCIHYLSWNPTRKHLINAHSLAMIENEIPSLSYLKNKIHIHQTDNFQIKIFNIQISKAKVINIGKTSTLIIEHNLIRISFLLLIPFHLASRPPFVQWKKQPPLPLSLLERSGLY